MIAKLLRRTVLLSGILLLSMSVVGLSVLAAPPKAAPPGGHLNITQVFVDFPVAGKIMIMGEDLDFGGPLDVTLGNFGSLVIDGTPTDTEIVADLPAEITAGDYLLTVSTGNGQSQNDEYDLTIGAVGPEGEKGVPGWERIDNTFEIAVGDTVGAFAICPAGKKPLGGGWFGPSTADVNLKRSEPDNLAYNVIVENISNVTQRIRVTVICAAVLP